MYYYVASLEMVDTSAVRKYEMQFIGVIQNFVVQKYPLYSSFVIMICKLCGYRYTCNIIVLFMSV